jgi:hypothetical protein
LSKVRIVQCLCPQRHCWAAAPYLSANGLPEPDKIDGLRQRIAKILEAAGKKRDDLCCGLCGSRKMHYEDAATPYSTMEEAEGPIAENAARQTLTREYFRRSRN